MGSPIKRARVESKMFPERASGSLGIASSAPHRLCGRVTGTVRSQGTMPSETQALSRRETGTESVRLAVNKTLR